MHTVCIQSLSLTLKVINPPSPHPSKVYYWSSYDARNKTVITFINNLTLIVFALQSQFVVSEVGNKCYAYDFGDPG
jgi:hypothetical protein